MRKARNTTPGRTGAPPAAPEQMKLAARGLDGVPQLGRDLNGRERAYPGSGHPPPALVNSEDLLDAWRAIPKRAKLHQHHRIGRQGAVCAGEHGPGC